MNRKSKKEKIKKIIQNLKLKNNLNKSQKQIKNEDVNQQKNKTYLAMMTNKISKLPYKQIKNILPISLYQDDHKISKTTTQRTVNSYHVLINNYSINNNKNHHQVLELII